MSKSGSKLKNADASTLDEFRKQLDELNSMARMGGSELSQTDIERIVEIHREEGLSLESCMDRLIKESKH